jgi:hypothetical protein
MTARYVNINGKRVRIEFSWNTVIEYLDSTKMDLDMFMGLAMGNKITPRHIRQLAWCGAIEGERMEGRDLGMNEIEFGAHLYPDQVREIMVIFSEQFSGVASEKKKPGKSPLVLFRRFR